MWLHGSNCHFLPFGQCADPLVPLGVSSTGSGFIWHIALIRWQSTFDLHHHCPGFPRAAYRAIHSVGISVFSGRKALINLQQVRSIYGTARSLRLTLSHTASELAEDRAYTMASTLHCFL